MDDALQAEERRFGKILIKLALASPEQVKECLALQKKAAGKAPRLGEIMIQKGYLTFAGLERAIRARQAAEDAPTRAIAKPAIVASIAIDSAPPEVFEAAGDPRRVFGKYVLVREIGRGGMGAVFQAWDSSLHRWIAVKILSDAGASEVVERFVREARTVASLVHPNIAPVYDVGEHGGKHYLAMQYIDGKTLGSDRVTTEEAVRILRDVALAVDFAHQKGIVHRDLKPDNILVDRDGKPFVTDFGLAKSLSVDSRITVHGSVMGTPAYMSPEQARGDLRRIGPRSDVYSLGATLYELLTGRPPFRGASPLETVAAVLERDPVRPSSRVAEVPPDAEAICLKAMEKDPLRRYASAGELARDCDRFLRGEPVSAAEAPRSRRRRRGRRGSLAMAIAAGGSLVLVLAAGIWLATSGSSRSAGPGDGPGRQDAPPPAGDGTPPPDPARHRAAPAYERGRVRLEEGIRNLERQFAERTVTEKMFQDAVDLTGEAVKIDPDYAEAWRARGLARSHLGDLDGAVSDYSAAVQLEPGNAELLLERGKVSLRLHWTRMERLGARWAAPDLWPERGFFDAALADFEAAAADREAPEVFQAYRAFAKLDPRWCLSILDGLGEVGELDGETLAFRAQVRHWQAMATLKEGSEERGELLAAAADDYRKAIEKRPGEVEWQLDFIACLVEARQLDPADDVIITLLPQIPEDPRIYVVAGDTYHQLGRDEREQGLGARYEQRCRTALDYYDRALSRDEGYVPALLGRGRSLFDLGDAEESARSFERATAENPRHPQATANLAALRIQQGRAAAAVELADRAIALKADVPYFHYVRGIALEGMGRRVEAREALEKALELGPSVAYRREIEAALARLPR